MTVLRRNCVVALLVLASILAPALSVATTVRIVAITPGRSVEVVIDQREPITIEQGQVIEGVKVVRVDSRTAVISVDGVTKTLSLEAGAASGHATGGGSVTLVADARGHFVTPGTINGRSVKFLVDTGATSVAISRAEASRIKLDYSRGKPTFAMTANGIARGWQVSLGEVRVGGVAVRDVPAVVLDSELSTALLGMSFLGRFDMQQRGSTLVLRRRAR